MKTRPDTGTRGNGKLEDFLSRRRARLADQLIPEWCRQGRILDIGHGMTPRFLAQTLFRERHGIDRISEEARARWAEENLHLVHQDLEALPSLPYPDEHFTTVTMLAVFEHVPLSSLVPLLKEVHRVLEEGGVYVMTTPAAWTGPLLNAMARANLVSHEEIGEHQGAYSLGEIRSIVVQGGFDPALISTGHFELGANSWAVAQKAGAPGPTRG